MIATLVLPPHRIVDLEVPDPPPLFVLAMDVAAVTLEISTTDPGVGAKVVAHLLRFTDIEEPSGRAVYASAPVEHSQIFDESPRCTACAQPHDVLFSRDPDTAIHEDSFGGFFCAEHLDVASTPH